MNKFLRTFFIVLFVSTALIIKGHRGRTDSRGGHNDRINGGYHFHHGEGPHQHPNGKCPYANDSDMDLPALPGNITYNDIWSFILSVLGLTAIMIVVVDQGIPEGRSDKEHIIRRLVQVTIFITAVSLIRSFF